MGWRQGVPHTSPSFSRSTCFYNFLKLPYSSQSKRSGDNETLLEVVHESEAVGKGSNVHAVKGRHRARFQIGLENGLKNRVEFGSGTQKVTF